MTHKPYESNIEERLMKGVRAIGGRAIKIEKRPGFPDRLVIMPGGYYVWVELKRPGGRLAEHQALAHDILRQLGCRVEILWSRDAVDNFLGRLANVRP